MSRRAALAAENLRRNAGASALSVLGVGVGVGALLFFTALGLGIDDVVRHRLFPVDATALEVVPPQLSLGKLLGSGALDDAAVARLRSLPGVRAAFPKMALRVPAISRYQGSFFGSQLSMAIEVVAVGVDPGLFEGQVAADKLGDPGAGSSAPLPCVVSSRLLEIYDKSFAPARHLPRLTPELVLGFQLPVDLGVSMVSDVGAMPRTGENLEVVGVSDRAMLAGVTLPLATVQRLNRLYHQDAETYSAVTLEAATPDAVPLLAQAVRGMGLQIDDEDRRRAEQAGAAVALIAAALGLLSALIILLAGGNIAQTLFASVRARARELAVMRAVGATRSDLGLMVILEASMVGALGGAGGAAASRLAGLGVDAAAAHYLPPLPFQPDTFFAFPTWLWALGVGIGVVSAIAGALLPARAAANTDPARALAG